MSFRDREREPRRSPGSRPVFADALLAMRIEALAAAEMRRFAQTALEMSSDSAARWVEVAGGVAAYLSADSPVNQAMGMGFDGPVRSAQIERLEHFYAARGVSPLACVCPHAHPTLLATLSERGWRADAFENVFFRELSEESVKPPMRPAGVEIREAVTGEDRELWKLVAATGFSWPLPPLDSQLALGEIIVRRPGTRLYLAWIDGRAAGVGELYVEDRVAWLSADTTLPQFRGRGVQQALQAHRMAVGAHLGCEIAVTEAAPGSGSQRNIERAGFRVAYSRVDLVLPAATQC